MSTETINICIPVFNEEKNLDDLHLKLKDFISESANKFNIKFDLIFFDDGSTDNSKKIIEKFENIKLIYSNENKGLGNAIKELMLYTKNSDAIGMFKIDGDGQMDPALLNQFIKNIIQKHLLLVVWHLYVLQKLRQQLSIIKIMAAWY